MTTRQWRGIGITFLMSDHACCFGALWFTKADQNQEQELTYSRICTRQWRMARSVDVTVMQNQDVPTGTVTLSIKGWMTPADEWQ